MILRDVSVANGGIYYFLAILIFKAVSGHRSQKTMVKMYKASIEIESCEILSCTCFSKIFGIEENFKPKLNLFLANVPILYPLKIPEKL